MVQLTFQHLFGMTFCQNCPDPNISSEPCQDSVCSHATAEGGILGRVDAVHTSLEAQKAAGHLHAHSQSAVQCLHHHRCLSDI